MLGVCAFDVALHAGDASICFRTDRALELPVSSHAAVGLCGRVGVCSVGMWYSDVVNTRERERDTMATGREQNVQRARMMDGGSRVCGGVLQDFGGGKECVEMLTVMPKAVAEGEWQSLRCLRRSVLERNFSEHWEQEKRIGLGDEGGGGSSIVCGRELGEPDFGRQGWVGVWWESQCVGLGCDGGMGRVGK